MAAPIPVLIPLLNPNETEALVAGLHVQAGQHVSPGDLLATFETTKSTGELHAEAEGFVVGLRFQPGESARAGEVLCYLAQRADATVPVPAAAPVSTSEASPEDAPVPEGLRITQPALALARAHRLDLAALPRGPMVTESAVRGLVANQSRDAGAPQIASPALVSVSAPAPFDASALIIYGGGGHGKSLVELVRALSAYRLVGVLDDGLHIDTDVLGLKVLGGAEALPGLYEQGVRLAVNAVGGIGNLAPRLKVFDLLAKAGFACPAVVHPRALVEASAELSAGVQVFPFAYVGSSARAGFGSIVNTGAIVSHDVVLGDYVNISPGAMLAGGVQVGEKTLVGMGVTINLNVKIGAGARIGNGATVKADVPAGAVVRAGSVWPE